MKIKIIKGVGWYEKEVGKIYEVTNYINNRYYIKDIAGFVEKSDCVIVDKNKMKIERTLIYISENVLPEEIDKKLKEMDNRIFEDKYEIDKIYCHTSGFRGFLIRWFAQNEKELKKII